MTTPGEFQVRPVITVPPRVAAGMADAMVTPTVEASVSRRWGIIDNINANGTLNVNIGGVVIDNIPRTATYNPRIGERVQIDVIGTDMVIVGPTYPSPRNQSINERAATVTSINSNGTLGLRLDDNTIVTAYRLVSYFPVLNETVRILQVGSTTDYLVIGNVANAPQQNRMPTGDIEPTLRKTPKPNTLFLQGQTVKRSDYPGLFAWAQEQGLLTTVAAPNNLFGAGDGSTTFVLPDMQDRVLAGASTTNPLGSKTGAETHTIAVANLPNHTHTGSVAVSRHVDHSHAVSNVGDHMHSWLTAQGGNHGGHYVSQVLVAAGPDYGVTTNVRGDSGTHNHTFDSGWGGAHNHTTAVVGNTAAYDHTATLTMASSGGSATPTPISNRQPTYSVNYMIWT